MKEIEIILNGLIHISLSIVMFVHIDRKCYPVRRTKLFFVIPLWSMFVGFYYLRSYIDGGFIGQYWRNFRIFETITNFLFLVFFMYKNSKLKKNGNKKI